MSAFTKSPRNKPGALAGLSVVALFAAVAMPMSIAANAARAEEPDPAPSASASQSAQPPASAAPSEQPSASQPAAPKPSESASEKPRASDSPKPRPSSTKPAQPSKSPKAPAPKASESSKPSAVAVPRPSTPKVTWKACAAGLESPEWVVPADTELVMWFTAPYDEDGNDLPDDRPALVARLVDRERTQWQGGGREDIFFSLPKDRSCGNPTPSQSPSTKPSEQPSEQPSETPSASPSNTPSVTPSATPSSSPTQSPTPPVTPTPTPSESNSVPPTSPPVTPPTQSPTTPPTSPNPPAPAPAPKKLKIEVKGACKQVTVRNRSQTTVDVLWWKAGADEPEGMVTIEPGATRTIKTGHLKAVDIQAVAWNEGYEPFAKNGIKVSQSCGTDKGDKDKGKGGDKNRGSGAKTGGDEPVVTSVVPMVVSEFDYSPFLFGVGALAVVGGIAGVAAGRRRNG